MDILTLILLSAAAGTAEPKAGPSLPPHNRDSAAIRSVTIPDKWQPLIHAAARRFEIPEWWIRAVMEVESSGRTMAHGRPIVSPVGAMGLMQIMPETYAKLRKAFGLGKNPHDPRDNILAGAAYLRLMYDQFGWPGLFAAYNAGPARFAAYLEGKQDLPAETRQFLHKLGDALDRAMPPPSAPIRTATARRHGAMRDKHALLGYDLPYEDSPYDMLAGP
ncbi:MAG TPA: lytic transglycosylase domain-containing protein [Ferrovibrio sp.]|uniref:lytic transglycosylase domain-containing protein n=1 Tax=Ferrovibrio sp. TaxID=1917215 RepID=UPI002ED44830